MKKIIIFVFIVIVLVAICVGYCILNKSKNNPEPNQQNNQIAGGDRDAHGCIGSAGYVWCGPRQKCLRIWEEACYASAEQEIQYLLARKYNKPASEVTIKATKKTADYMAGTVSFAAKGLPAPGEGGMFLAAKQGNAWILVYDGNGSIDCESIKTNYQFPADMLKGFCD